MDGRRTDRFTWERAVLDPKVGMPRELGYLALVLATYSTGQTGGDISVSEATLRDLLGYDHARSIRRLIAELRDGYGVIERVKHGNQHSPAEYVLVIPGDLAGRGEAARDARVARAEANGRPVARGAPDKVRPKQTGEHRTARGSAPDIQRPSTGQGWSSYQETKDQAPLSPLPPRAELAGLGATEREIDFILTKITDDPRVRSPAAYLRTAIANGDGPELLSQARRELGAHGTSASPARPPWCGQCDQGTRLIELDDDRMARCPRCHPLAGEQEGTRS
jgi:hypothetical protein